jgi:CBS domain-containing protein
MKIKEIMTSDFETISSGSSLTAAAQKMQSLNVGILPVEEEGRIVGLVTDRDIVVRGLAEGHDPAATEVRDILTADLVCCQQDDTVEEAVRQMEDHKVRRLIVCDRDGLPVGIVSLGDIASKTGQEQLAGEALEMISEPAAPVK